MKRFIPLVLAGTVVLVSCTGSTAPGPRPRPPQRARTVVPRAAPPAAARLVFGYVNVPDFGLARPAPVAGEYALEPGAELDLVTLDCSRRLPKGQVFAVPSRGSIPVRAGGPFRCRPGGPQLLETLHFAQRLRQCARLRPRPPTAALLRQTAGALLQVHRPRGTEAQDGAEALGVSLRPTLVVVNVLEEVVVPVPAPCQVRDCHLNPRRPVIGARRTEETWVSIAVRLGATTQGRLAVPPASSVSIPVPFLDPPTGAELEALKAIQRSDLGAAARALDSLPPPGAPPLRALLLAFARATLAARLEDLAGLGQALARVRTHLADPAARARLDWTPLQHWVEQLQQLHLGQRRLRDPCRPAG